MTTSADANRRRFLLIDTHALVWLVRGNTRLGETARTRIQQAADEGCVLVSAITPWEIGLLVSKGRLQLEADVMEWIHRAMAKPGICLASLDPEIAVSSTRLPFEMHADPADRILVATARHLGATLVTADEALLELAGKRCFLALDARV